MTTVCSICESISEECPADFKTIDQSRMKLVKSILKLAGIQFKCNKSDLADICAQCNKDLESFEKFLVRIVNSINWGPKLPTQTSLPVDSEMYKDSIDETDMNDTFEQNDFGQSKRTENEITHDILSGKRLRRPIDSIDETNMNDNYKQTKKRSTEISHDILALKRSRRPPRRFRDGETFSAKDQMKHQRPIDISINQKHLQNSQFDALPKMAEIRISDDLPPIGDIVEVQSSGKFSRLRILCRACTEAFSQENIFREHFSVNHQNKDNQWAFNEMNLKFLYFCTLCKKKFYDHFSVRRHFKTTHTELRVFSCDLCPAAYKYKTNLEKHKAKHLNLKKHECPECFKKFVGRYDLLIHYRTHTGEKPFKCQTCPSKFSNSSNLKKHQLTHRKNSKSINFLESNQNRNIPEQISEKDDYTEDNREKSNQIKINSTTEESKEITEEISTKLNFQQQPYNSSINTVMINASKTNANIVDNLNGFSNLCSAEVSSLQRSTERGSQFNITPKKLNKAKIPQILLGKKLQFNQLKLKSILKNNAYPSAAKKESIRLNDCSVESQLNKTIRGNNSITELSVVCLISKSNHGIKTQTVEEFKPKNQLKFLTCKSTDNNANNIIHINSTNAEENNIMECNEYTNEKLPVESPSSPELQSQAKDADKLLKRSEVNQFYDFPKTCMRKSPQKLKILPNSLLKPQGMLQPSNKPIITNVKMLPQLNLKFKQRHPLSENDSSPAPCIFKLPADYKFQCPSCGKYFKQKSALTKHLRTHSGEKPYKCQICPKSYADASNYKKHKLLHTEATDASNKLRQKPPLSPALSSVTDPDPDGIEVLHTVKPFELTTSEEDAESDDDLESYHLWKDALEQQPFINKDIQENIRRNLKAIMPPIPAEESSYLIQRSGKLFSPKRLQCNSLD